MNETHYVDEETIQDKVYEECEFTIENHGIGYYEAGDGKYNDISMGLTLTPCDIVVEYPVDVSSVIFTLVTGTYNESDNYGRDYECEWCAELSHIEYNTTTRLFDVTYTVEQA
jgi:hypothetical protein